MPRPRAIDIFLRHVRIVCFLQTGIDIRTMLDSAAHHSDLNSARFKSFCVIAILRRIINIEPKAMLLLIIIHTLTNIQTMMYVLTFAAQLPDTDTGGDAASEVV